MSGLIRRVVRDGGPGFCQFAITDACNAHCAFCNFRVEASAPDKRVFVDAERAAQAIDILAANGVEYLAFVGGEPALHPSLDNLISHSKRLGMTTLLCTNGATLGRETIDQWAYSGLGSIIISIDATDVETHERNRGLPGVCSRIADANDWFRTLGVPTAASVTISRLVPDLDALPAFLKSLGFDRVTFSYPLRALESSFRGYSLSDLVTYTDDELCAIFDSILELKRRFTVLNPSESIREMKRFVRSERQIFPCLAGFKYFYLDWEFDLYRCHAWHEPMCQIWDFDSSKLVRDGCTKCMIDCYRDASVLQGIAVASHDAWQHLNRLQPLAAARCVFNGTALGSLRAVVETGAWQQQVKARKTDRGGGEGH
jgi:MoaA/NifB/PqqE/SkfB family radical SAM enzyme